MTSENLKDFAKKHKKEIAIGTICMVSGILLGHKFKSNKTDFVKTAEFNAGKVQLKDLGTIGEALIAAGESGDTIIEHVDLYYI